MAFPISDGVGLRRYTHVRLLAQHVSGAVYYAKDPVGQPVAVFEVNATHPSFARERERFEGEARVHRQLSHPNIRAVYECIEEPRTRDIYLVAEYTNGGSLADALASRGPLSEREALEVALHVCQALAAAAEGEVHHGAVRPACVFLKVHVRGDIIDVKLGGFGKPTDWQFFLSDPTTTPYLAPEQISGRGVATAPGDVFSVGCMLWEMLTRTQLKSAFTQAGPPDLQALIPSIQPATAAIVHRAIQVEPDRRYPSAWAMADDLAATLAGRPLARSSTPAAPRTVRVARSAPGRSRLAWLGVPLGLLVITLAIVVVLFQRTGAPSASSSTNAPAMSIPQLTMTLDRDSSTAAAAPSTLPSPEVAVVQPAVPSPDLRAASATLEPTHATPVPMPAGVSTEIGNDEIGVAIESVEFTPAESRTDGAVFYTLRITNKTDQPMTVRLSLRDIVAADSAGVQYIDYLVKRQAAVKRHCIVEVVPLVDYAQAIEREFDIKPHDSATFNDRKGYLYLTKADSCKLKSRVALDVDYIDLRIATIGYRTATFELLTELHWRLYRR